MKARTVAAVESLRVVKAETLFLTKLSLFSSRIMINASLSRMGSHNLR
jgi:hypothetical protein